MGIPNKKETWLSSLSELSVRYSWKLRLDLEINDRVAVQVVTINQDHTSRCYDSRFHQIDRAIRSWKGQRTTKDINFSLRCSI